MKKLIIIASLLSFNAISQKKSSIGINLPLFVDNQFEVSYQHQIHKRVRLIGILGASPNTRGIFINRGSNPYYNQNFNGTKQIISDVAAGGYGKLGVNFIFNLPDLFDDFKTENSNVKFYVGPAIGFSKYNQSGTSIETIYENGANLIKEQTEKETGQVMGTGFTLGLTFGTNKDFSADFGMEYLGFERKSVFQNEAHTLGLGVSGVIRINYNFGK